MMKTDNVKTVVRSRKKAHGQTSRRTPEQSDNVLPVGSHLDEFEILDLIGEGGFGIVYLAYDHSLERQVALKEYMPAGLASRSKKMVVTVRSQHNLPTFTAGLKSFVNEAKMLAQFDAPSLVKVHRFWEANGTAYMVMPYYDGVTLKRAMKERRLAPSESWVRILLADLFDAIETIHRAQCLHRDIAPDNILLLKDDRPLLLDFGAARRVIGDLTQCLTVILKPGFAPIEQYADIAGLRQGPWTDIYALAAVVYYIIAGESPPPAVARFVHDEMVPAREAGKGRYSASFLTVLDKALAVNPENRFRSIAELRRALNIQESEPRTLPRSSEQPNQTAILTTRMADPPTRPNGGEGSTDKRPGALPLRTAAAARWSSLIDHLPTLDKRLWIVLGMLVAATAASGIYLGKYRTAKHAAEPALADTSPVPIQNSSGASGDEEPDSSARLPAITPTPQAPQAKAAPPASVRSNDALDASTERDAAPSARLAPEDELWRTVSKADKAGGYEKYLREYPKGRYAAVSKLRLERLRPEVAAVAPPNSAPAVPTPAPAAPSAEEQLWGMVTALNQPHSYEGYLSRYPSGRYAALAKEKLASFKRAEPASEAKPAQEQSAAALRSAAEDELWRNVSKADNASGYERYLREYPKGRYAAVTKLRLDRLQSNTASTPPSAPPATSPAVPLPAPTAQATPPAEDQLWSMVTSLNQAQSYESYLNRYPNGRYAATAKEKMAALKAAEPAVAPAAPLASAPSTSDRKPPDGTDKPVALASPESAPSAPPAPRAVQESAPPKPAVAAAARPSTTLRVDGQIMTGDFSVDPVNGSVSGTGKIVWPNGDQFEGTLVRGVKQGKGKFTWRNGQRYSGDWSSDKPNGKGTIVFADGNRYEGAVKDGVPHGQGVNRFTDGDVYSGAWLRGKSNGHGRYTWAGGSYWEGEFKDDKRTDNGKMFYADGSKAAATEAPAASSQEPQKADLQQGDKTPVEK